VTAPEERAGEVLARIRHQRYASAALIAVCSSDGRLAGLVTIEALLAATPDARMHTLMAPDPVTVTPAMSQEQAATVAAQQAQSAVAVVDPDGRFQGVIPPQRLLSVLLAEHHEDLARLGGFLHSADTARLSTVESVPRRLWHRLPWLGLGLAGAMLSAGLMNAFERQLDDLVLIAFFIPGIVYLADAVGTQTETIAIRGLPLGVPIRQIAPREALTGVLIGGCSGRCCYQWSRWCGGIPRSPWRWRSRSPPRARWPAWWRWPCRGCCTGSVVTPPSAPGRWAPYFRICCRWASIWR